MRERKAVADSAKCVFHAPDINEARQERDHFVELFAKTAPKAAACLEDAFDDVTAVLCFPEKYRKRLRSTNMQERLNEEIRRRERVVRVFPNEEAALRLIGALLAEIAETWQKRLCLDMQEFRDWQSDRPKDLGSGALLSVAS